MAEQVVPYPVARMAFHILFLLSLGTSYAFSVWSSRFIRSSAEPGPFPNWSQAELNLLYSWGVLGGFCMPFGGRIYDLLGPRPTYLCGLVAALVGLLGMLSINIYQWVPTSVCPHVMAAMYFMEELGAGTLYMGIVMDTLLHFPAKSRALSSSIVGLTYNFSALGASILIPAFDVSISMFFGVLASAMLLFSVIRIFLLGDIHAESVACGSDTGSSGNTQTSSLKDILVMPVFLCFMGKTALAVSPCVAFMGIMRSFVDAAGGNGEKIASVALVVGSVNRILVGLAYDRFQLHAGRVILTTTMVLCSTFGVMAALSFQNASSRLIQFGSIAIVVLFGILNTVSNLYIKQQFMESACGLIVGMRGLAIAIGNFLFTLLFAPAETRASGDFTQAFQAAMGLSFFACLVFVPHSGVFAPKHTIEKED